VNIFMDPIVDVMLETVYDLQDLGGCSGDNGIIAAVSTHSPVGKTESAFRIVNTILGYYVVVYDDSMVVSGDRYAIQMAHASDMVRRTNEHGVETMNFPPLGQKCNFITKVRDRKMIAMAIKSFLETGVVPPVFL
jgi:hypothetical protein